jgi:hypothetical protein
MPAPDVTALSAQDLVGQRLTSIDTTSAPNFWIFRFEHAQLSVETIWRLVSENQVIATGDDHGQMFGHRSPVDSSSRLLGAVGEQCVSATSTGPVIGDLTLKFGPQLRLELLVRSSGYESWMLARADGTQLVAVSGGRLALFGKAAG